MYRLAVPASQENLKIWSYHIVVDTLVPEVLLIFFFSFFFFFANQRASREQPFLLAHSSQNVLSDESKSEEKQLFTQARAPHALKTIAFSDIPFLVKYMK